MLIVSVSMYIVHTYFTLISQNCSNTKRNVIDSNSRNLLIYQRHASENCNVMHMNVQCEMCGKSLTVHIASVHEGNKLYKSHQYLTNVQCSYRRFGREKFTSMNLLQMPFVITWA